MILRYLRELVSKDSFIRRYYRQLKSLYYYKKERSFLNVSLSQIHHIQCTPSGKPELLLITIAYNNPIVLGQQLRLLSKYLLDSYFQIVVDNSSNQSIRKENEALCRRMKVGYVSLHHNFYTKSNSHGLALNWAYEHLIKWIQPTYFGLLDHDVYPICEQSLLPILRRQVCFGKREERDQVWYLWPGFSFFSTSSLIEHSVDFKPDINRADLDTGGLLYQSFYSQVNIDHYLFPSVRLENIREGFDVESDMVEYLQISGQDYWLHSINGGYWKKVNAKEDMLNTLLNQY